MNPRQQRKLTRTREVRACTECRRRKLRCDRQSPCTSCARRGEATHCVYEALQEPRSEHERRLRAEEKLDHLEQLLHHISNSQEQPNGHSVPSSSNGYGERHETYNGGTHWSAMLEDIDELRSVVNVAEFEGAGSSHDVQPDHGTDILFGHTHAPSYQQILSSLPPRKDADRLVASYFRAKALAAPFIHSAQFRRQYRDFWESPNTSPALWVSMLFSIFDIASRALASMPAAQQTYDIAAAQCLVVGRYHWPQRFAFEALLLYLQAKCLARSDISEDIAVLFGTLGRLATSMGYHRRDVAGVTLFEDEMRCRAWSLYIQLDLLVSFQLGLPSNIQYETWDTRAPRNLLDSDFDEDAIALPLARPDEEPTELLLYITKHRLMRVFDKILRHSLKVTRDENDFEVISRELDATYAALPRAFRALPMADSVVDAPSVIVSRLCVYFIYQKCRCVLHRRRLFSDERSSWQICYDAALGIVHRLLDIHHEFEPGGQLENEKWFMGSICWHDFLLGCTVLCLCVCRGQGEANESAGFLDLAASLALLQGSLSLCEPRIASSKDSRQVHALIRTTLARFRRLSDTTADPPVLDQHSELYVRDSTYEGDGQHGPGLSPYSDGMPLTLEQSEWAFMSQFLQLSG